MEAEVMKEWEKANENEKKSKLKKEKLKQRKNENNEDMKLEKTKKRKRFIRICLIEVFLLIKSFNKIRWACLDQASITEKSNMIKIFL